MNVYHADLQIHSCLSPCGALENSPRAIVRRAKEQALDIIALTDHNTALNCPALADCCRQEGGLTAFFGVEVTTAEEIHVLCLFGDVDPARGFGEFVSARLPARTNDPERFGDQPVVDADNTILFFDDHFLVGTTDIALDDLVRDVHQRGGVAIASHADRAINSVLSQLGVWPADVPFDACDLSPFATPAAMAKLLPRDLPVLRSSDAHFLVEIGRARTGLRLAAPTFAEFQMALRGEAGRGIETSCRSSVDV